MRVRFNDALNYCRNMAIPTDVSGIFKAQLITEKLEHIAFDSAQNLHSGCHDLRVIRDFTEENDIKRC